MSGIPVGLVLQDTDHSDNDADDCYYNTHDIVMMNRFRKYFKSIFIDKTLLLIVRITYLAHEWLFSQFHNLTILHLIDKHCHKATPRI